MDSFGEYLKRERELREITLEEIRDSTKINLRFLQALETNNFDMLPGKFFTRGIIRSYANYIGLDVGDVLHRYDEFHFKESSPEEEETGEKSQFDERKPSSKNKIILWTSIIIVLILISVIFFYKYEKKQLQISQIAILEETEVPEIKEKILPDIEPGRMESGFKLEFSVGQETWFQIYADGELTFDGIKEMGETFQVNAQKEIIMHVGNAGGFTFSINGREGKPLGLSGQVIRNILINMDNYKNYIQNGEFYE
jgi:cytoskeleton protein RodZ